MKTFEITIPPLRSRGLSISLTIEALSWQDALQLASNELHEELGLDPEMAATPRQQPITVRDLGSGDSYTVDALPAPSEADSETLREDQESSPKVLVDHDALTMGVSGAGSWVDSAAVAAAVEAVEVATDRDRRPDSDPNDGIDRVAAEDVDEPIVETLPPRRGPRAITRKNVAAPKETIPQVVAAVPAVPEAEDDVQTLLGRSPLDVEDPPEAQTLLGSLEDVAGELSRPAVKHPGLHKVSRSSRTPAAKTQVQERPKRALSNATLMDNEHIPQQPRPTLGPVVVQNNRLQKVRTIMSQSEPSHNRAPHIGQSNKEPSTPYYRPVSRLGQAGTGTLMELIDGAVNMAYDHVPCEAVQCLMYLEDRDELYVAASRGRLSVDITDAFVALPIELGIERLNQPTPTNFSKRAFDLTYVRAGDDHSMQIQTALWVPIVVEAEVVGIMMVANSKHRKGFSPGELRGAEYLTETLSKEIQHFLAAAEQAPRAV